MWETLLINANVATMTPGDVPYGAVENGAVGISDGRIVWVGRVGDLPEAPERCARTIHDLNGRWITPGLIDCHTHIVYGGDRAEEFELRLNGTSYEEIARRGGGIRSTVTATRDASEADLWRQSAKRVEALLAEGVTTLEIKSGYGLDLDDEAKQLRVARRLGQDPRVDVVTTFLGAHAVPPEYDGDPDGYVDLVCDTILPEVARQGLADAVDVFCESIGFTAEQTERVFAAAALLGLPVKGHIGQLSDLGGAELAARSRALSCDHLEYVSEAGVAAMAGAGTVAVLLPGAFYCLRETTVPPVDLFRRHQVPIALATDCNPGSSPVASLLLILNLACTLFRMTPEEALSGVTRHAAMALGLGDSIGTIEPGKAADLAIWDIARPAELSYRIGGITPAAVFKGGHCRSGDRPT